MHTRNSTMVWILLGDVMQWGIISIPVWLATLHHPVATYIFVVKLTLNRAHCKNNKK